MTPAGQSAKTDNQGSSHFADLAAGQQTIAIKAEGYQGEQIVNLQGPNHNLDLTLTVSGQAITISWWVYIGLIVLILIIVFLIILRKRRND